MKIDLTCPVELWQYAMPTETDSECTFVMNNLSDKVVTSVQVTLNCFDQNDELLFRQTERVQGLKAGVGERFTVVVLPSEWNGVEGVDLVIEKVWFDDATIWRKGNAPLTFYSPNVLQPGRALDELRFVAGQDAAGYPQRQDAVWMCVCGRPNALSSDCCCRCERRRDTVFASFTRENVNHVIAAHEQKLAETARKAREENNILQENQEKQRAAKRRRRNNAIRLTGTLVLLAVMAVVAVVWGIPTVKYNTAVDLLAGGHYDQASAAFSEMGDYKDAMTQVLECDFQKAAMLHKLGDAESLQQAQGLFAALADYQNSAERALQAGYDLGVLYLEQENYEQAADMFLSLGSYQDSNEKRMESIYSQAEELLDAGSFEQARAMFAQLGAYSDAAERVNECSRSMAEVLMTDGNYHAAIDLLLLVDGDAAAELLGQCYYALAEAELTAQAFEAAGEWFLKAGAFADAQDRANECFYKLAQEKREAGEYEKAMALYLRIPAYSDSVEMAQQCVYDQAAALAENGDLPNAIALLESITDFADAEELLDQYRFKLAEQVLSEGDAEQAERLLEVIGEHKGLETQLKKVRYQLAENAMKNGAYQDAIVRYELLGSYKNSKSKIKQCRYALANAEQEAGRYENAIVLYEELGNYKSSAERIKQCRYAIACAALDKAEYETAVILFEEMGGYEDSKALRQQAQYQQAMALKEAGLTAEAMESLAAINSDAAKSALSVIRMEEAARLEETGDYEAAALLYAAENSEEANAHYLACQYQLAQQLYETGDLPGAAAAFHALGEYEDAAARSEQCYNEYYGQVAQGVRDLYAEQDYAGVIRELQYFEMNVLSQTYEDLPQIFADACLALGDQLYAEGKAYEAIPYYQHAGAQDKLDRRAYLILGEWKSATGKTASFRTDGTCDLMGETMYFRVSNFSLYTGASPESMTITHKISVLDETGMSLRDQRNGEDVLYKLTRTSAFELPRMELPAMDKPENEPEAAETEDVPETSAAEELLVTEESNETNE